VGAPKQQWGPWWKISSLIKTHSIGLHTKCSESCQYSVWLAVNGNGAIDQHCISGGQTRRIRSGRQRFPVGRGPRPAARVGAGTWRVRARRVGPSVRSMAAAKAPAVSSGSTAGPPSGGRRTESWVGRLFRKYKKPENRKCKTRLGEKKLDPHTFNQKYKGSYS